MFSTRPLRKLAACIAILGMLFTQFAVSAFACPAIAKALEASAMQATMETADAQPCHQTADVPAGLCKAHCEDGQKNVSGSHVVLADFVPAFAITHPIENAGEQSRLAFTTTRTVPTGSTPIHLRNCVFRI